MMKMTQVTMAALAVVMAQGAFAAVSADEAKQLGSTLTLTGAEKAGNKDGTIPAYSGKAPKAPASFSKRAPGQRPDPYGDKPLFSITAANAAQYADKLDGMIELFKKYPNFRMDIYPTRRDFVYPKYVLDNTIKNATACKAVEDEQKLEGCYGGVPFPIPKTGKQVMWNHLLQYANYASVGIAYSWVTPPNGKAILAAINYNYQQYDFYNPKDDKPRASNSPFWKIQQADTAPARRAGGKLVIIDTLDMVRRVYQYIPGQRRVKLAPNLAFDTPSPITSGSSTMDDIKSFAGSMERYNFSLAGKKEKFIMYNNYMMNDANACSSEKIVNNANFPHPDCVRWELHRVWQVDAALKPEYRHIYAKRKFYWDEDVAGGGIAENYDAGGKLYRIASNPVIPFYDLGGGEASQTVYWDLQTGAWSLQGDVSNSDAGWVEVKSEPFDERQFSPDALAGSGTR